MIDAMGPRRVIHRPLEWANDARVFVELRRVDPEKGQGACIELRRVRVSRRHERIEETVLEQVPYYGRPPAEVAQDIEQAFKRAEAVHLVEGRTYTYVAATHYLVRVLRLTPHRAEILGRYRHGGELRRWVRRSELS